MTPYLLITTSHLLMILAGISGILIGFGSPIIWVLAFLGWAGLHARQFRKAGWAGHLGLALILISSVLPGLLWALELIREPAPHSLFAYADLQAIRTVFLIAGIQVLGLFIYAFATYRAKVLPKSVPILLVLWAVLAPILSNPGTGLCISATGFVLWRSRKQFGPHEKPETQATSVV